MSETLRPFIAGLIQMRSGREPVVNCDAAVRLIREAAVSGAEYVQTPEMTSLVERSRKSLFEKIGPQEKDPLIAALREVAREKRIVIHIGSVALRAATRSPIARGHLARRRDRCDLRQDPPLRRRPGVRRELARILDLHGGQEAVVAQTPLGPVGVTICYDLRFPYLYRELAQWGASYLTAPSCFTRQTGEAHWHVLQRARAIENGAFMLSAAQGGTHEDGRETFGHSIIVDPWGRVLAEGGNEPGVILAKIDPALVVDARERIPSLLHTRPVTVAGARPSAAKDAA